jgi:MFS family permease
LTTAAEHRDDFLVGRNINGYYAYHLFINLAFWLPIYAVFFLSHGLSFSAILWLYAVDTGFQTVLEIPSGMLADRYGRKMVLILGALFQTAGYLMIAVGGQMGWYLAAMALHGAALAFVSGSDAAFIYDSLAAAGRENEFKATEGRAYMFNLFGWGTGGLLGGLLAAQSLALPFILSALSSILALLVALTCVEPPRSTAPPAPRAVMKEAYAVARHNRRVRAMVVFASLIIGLLLVTHKFSQPYLQRAGVDLRWFGGVYFIWLLCAAVSANFSGKVEQVMGRGAFFLSLPVMVGGVLVYLGLHQNLAGVALIILHQFTWGALRPQMNEVINREVGTRVRATLLSAVGFGSSLVYIIATPAVGIVADRYDFPRALLWLGIAALAAGLWAAVALIRSERTSAIGQESVLPET